MADRSHWPVKVFRTPEEAEADDRAFYASLTSKQRIDMMFEIIGDHDPEPRLDRVPRITKRPPR